MYEHCFLHSAVLQYTTQLLFVDLVVFFDKFSYVASADI